MTEICIASAGPHREIAVSSRWIKRLCAVAAFAFLPWLSTLAHAANTIEAINYAALPGNRVEFDIRLSGPAPAPRSFTIDNPARLALDFADTTSALEKKTENVGVGMVRSVTTVQSGERTRIVLNLVHMVGYQTRVDGNHVYLTVDGGAAAAEAESKSAAAPFGASAGESRYMLKDIDFRRGEKGAGRIVVTLSDAAAPVDVRTEGGKLVVEFMDTGLPRNLERRLDVADFATPITYFDTTSRNGRTRIAVNATGDYQHLAYQADTLFTLEVRPTTPEDREAARREGTGYRGEKLSLNFQNIEVRAVLQVISDFTGLNMVIGDNVSGNISLRLKDVPWDQALDIILKTRGLGMRQSGNILMIAPADELAKREAAELSARQAISELEPLRSELIQINYAKASELAALIKAKENSMLSKRGNISIDERTNTLLVQDTSDRLSDIRKLVTRLDVPVRQVVIESRIVIANNDFSRDLGARFGGTVVKRNGDGIVTTSGAAAGTDATVRSALDNLRTTGQPFPVEVGALNDRLNVNMPVTARNAGRWALAILGKDYLLDLELSALQAEGRGEVVSSPRVVTANQKEALIEQGVEIPYLEASSSGAATVSFKKAVLSLRVTPQITPDDRVIMDLAVNKDSVGEIFQGVPSINTREINTQALVDNGETVVLGGIYEQTRSKEVDKVPFLGDLPVVGGLFRQTRQVDDKVELLIFVTPKILKESLGVR